MNFFEHQERARRSSRRLVVLFVLAVLAIVAAVDVALAAGWLWSSHRPPPRSLYFWGAAIALACIVFGSLREMARLGAGGEALAQLAGGRRVAPESHEALERRLLNVVEEMAIASGVRVPKVYVLDGEPGINAFAAGYDVSHAVIGVTRGALEQLSRDELQGVIGHEFSHLVNGDMALNLRMIGVLAGIVSIGSLGAFVMRRVRGRGRNAGAALFVGLALFVIGYAGLFFARLIKAGLARQREFLADASSVQFTRNPDGLCGALDRMRSAGGRIGGRYAEAMSHMFFGQALSLGGLFATHPPLEERIRRINPRFQAAADADRTRGERASAAPARADGRRGTDLGVAWGHSPAQSAALVGTLEPAQLEQAGTLLDAIAAPLREALREPESAAAAVAALIAAPKAEVLEAQLAALKSAGLAEMAEPVRAALPLVQSLDQALHLPVVDLALPALKGAPEEAKKRLVGTLQALAYADRRVSLHEFVLLALLRYQLAPVPKKPGGKRRLAEMPREAGALIAVVAHASRRVDEALAAGAAEIGLDAAAARDAALSLEAVSAALEAARELAPLEKARLVKALFAAATADGTVRVGEFELLRLVGAVLDCPLPPLIETMDPRQLAPG
jgi:Zn-dependent protease with chaperone function